MQVCDKTMHEGGIVEGSRQADGVRQCLGEDNGLVAPREGLVWIAELPEGPGDIGEAPRPEVQAIAEGQMMVLLALYERQPLLQVYSTRGKLSTVVFCSPQCMAGHQQERRILHALGQTEALLGHLPRGLVLSPHEVKPPQPPLDREALWRLSHLLAQLARPSVGL